LLLEKCTHYITKLRDFYGDMKTYRKECLKKLKNDNRDTSKDDCP